jgi:hypothetical protein
VTHCGYLPDDELRRSWRAFVAGLEGSCAPPRPGHAARPVDEEFELFWDRAEAVLYGLSCSKSTSGHSSA